ncbi:MAG: PH domain-containing protein [Jiangellaceae bacterium]|nr:PH domain-containing protein [Jiangellaceae bacterium]
MRTPQELLTAGYDRWAGWLDRIAEDGGLMAVSRWRLKNAAVGLFGQRMVNRKLIPGERKIREVKHIWLLYVGPVALGLLGLFLAVRWLPAVDADNAWFPAAIILGILGYAFYWILKIARDRFVVTDSRVFRVWGVFTLREAEMEIVRVLDVTVFRPWYLRPVRGGNVVLENAAQEQGLRLIEWVPEPDAIAGTIHRRRRQMMGLGEEDAAAPRRPQPASTAPPRRRRADHPRSPGRPTARPH